MNLYNLYGEKNTTRNTTESTTFENKRQNTRQRLSHNRIFAHDL
jgi:hypothetical protein